MGISVWPICEKALLDGYCECKGLGYRIKEGGGIIIILADVFSVRIR